MHGSWTAGTRGLTGNKQFPLEKIEVEQGGYSSNLRSFFIMTPVVLLHQVAASESYFIRI